MNIPLPKGIVGDVDIPTLQESLVNLFNPGDNTLLKTPGITAFSFSIGACRGVITFNEQHYQVSGETLALIAENGFAFDKGTIEGINDVAMSTSFIALEIVVKGGKGYSLSSSDVLTEIGGAYRPSVDVAAINQRFVFVPSDGGPLFFTDVNAPTTIPSLNFFDAEFLPDKNKGVINLRNDLYVGGETSFEVFRDTGDEDAPFIRVDGAAVETGYVAAKARYKDTFVFLGRDREGDFAFHAMGSGDAPKISNPAIEEILQTYTVLELEACTSQRFTFKGIDMVCFRLERDSLLFYGSGWAHMQTGVDGLGVVSPWNVKFMSFAYGKYITGSATDNRIGALSEDILEFGQEIERVIETFIRAESSAFFMIDNIYMKCLTGTSLAAGSIALQVSRDNLTYGPQVPRSLAAGGLSTQQVSWLGGAGQFESYAGLRLRTTSDVNFSCDGLSVNV